MILLINVDLPEFGRPITAICSGFSLVGILSDSKVASSLSFGTSISTIDET